MRLYKKLLILLLIPILSFAAGKNDTKSPDSLSIIKSDTPEGILNSRIIFLADQLERNVDKNLKRIPVIVTSFVDLDNLTKTNTIGRLIAESLKHELQVRKWKILDIRITKNIYVNKNGEFVLSRNIKKLKSTKGYEIGGILTGTYSFIKDSLIINAEIIDLSNGLVVSTGQIILPANIFDSELYEGGTVNISISGD